MNFLLQILFLSIIIIKLYGYDNIFTLPTSTGWARWSDFSTCSSECGPGIQYQMRRCLDIYCSGSNKRFRSCNGTLLPETCRSSEKLKEIETCEFINQKKGRYEYISSNDMSSDCKITCKSILTSQIIKTNITKIDGNYCNYNKKSRGICFNGICQYVGCDNIINSTSKIDNCGKCVSSLEYSMCEKKDKGDTSSLFQWNDNQQFSSCDKSCGPERYKISIPICINKFNNKTVPETFCANLIKPIPIVEKCSYVVCPDKWIKSKWSDCSKSCGEGIQSRNVYCVESHNESVTPNIPEIFRVKRDNNNNEIEMTNRKVEDKYCWKEMKPKGNKQCNLGECPKWGVGDWSLCSVTCSNGFKTRNVDCLSGNKRVEQYYCNEEKPKEIIPCYTGLKCPSKNFITSQNKKLLSNKFSLPTDDIYGTWKLNKYGYQNDDSSSFKKEDQGSSEDENYIHYLTNNNEEPHYEVGEWNKCSVTCGSGIKIRTVQCVSTRGMNSRGTIKLRDYECEGQKKPEEFEICEEAECPMKDDMINIINNSSSSSIQLLTNNDFKTLYKWDYGEWSRCVNGKEKSNLKCIDTVRKVPVSWKYCDPKQRPIERTRSCQQNNNQESGEWEILPWSECTSYCGGGVKTRKVRCSRRLESNNNDDKQETVILDDGKCGGVKPLTEESCNNIDCEAKWKVEPWSECSTTCGPGEQRRYVVCQQVTSQGKLRIFDSFSPCDGIPKPPTVQLCNYGPCNNNNIKYNDDNTIFPQQSVQKSAGPSYDATEDHHKKLTLNVGGYANLYEGTSLKIKCPVKNFDKSLIIWRKNGKKIQNTSHIKVSTNGALRIFHAKMSDAGVYSCLANNGIQGNVTLSFKHRNYNDRSHNNRKHNGNNHIDDADRQLLQLVKSNVKKVGDNVFYEKIINLKEPGRIKADFIIGNWSDCSLMECNIGEEGTQVRAVKCQLSYKELTTYVDDIVCEQFGVIKVPSSRSCKPDECPFWDTEEWSDCSESRCIHQGTAIQKRNVRCLFANLTIAESKFCDRGGRPKVKRECINKNCVAEWKPSTWGSCSKTCGDDGIQMRILKCVWHGTKKPAGRQCTNIPRPSAIKYCNTAVPCPTKNGLVKEKSPEPFKGKFVYRSRGRMDINNNIVEDRREQNEKCIDISRFCDIYKIFKSCHEEDVKQKCCFTCSFNS
uniref:Ig-like domain-containing protein n=1 Tax=Parastrongyloides trichosuri TaxID=131310 RepID=A0A0N4ZKU1_PARTI